MKKIRLTQGQIALVDDEDFDRLNQHKWHASHTGREYYARRSVYLGKDPSTGKYINQRVSMASEVLNTTEMVDHKSHNTLDNQKQNLRNCTVKTNNQNRRVTGIGTSRYKGVHQRQQKWRARIKLRNVFDQFFSKSLGDFEDEIEAAKAYDKAAKEEFGEFACLNFEEETE